MTIASNGYVFVPDGVDDASLQALRAEADWLFGLNRSQDTLTEEEYFDKGCALDFFTSRSMTEDDEARVSMEKYMSRRNGVARRRPRQDASSRTAPPSTDIFGRGNSDTMATTPGLSMSSSRWRPSPSFSPTKRIEQGPARSRAATDGDPPGDGDDGKCGQREGDGGPSLLWEDCHVSVVRKAIFGRLAGLAWDALEDVERSAETGAPCTARRKLLLFNEQYVVKPPESSIEFGWHTDEREQLAMCVFAPGVKPPVYVSVWLALDDCDAANGCLEMYPQAWSQKRLQVPGDGDDACVVGLPAKAGSAVVFLSNVWHRSGPNQTNHPRRVFYAQYSLDVIRAAPSDPRPLSLAVPCCLFLPSSPKSRGVYRQPIGGLSSGNSVSCPGSNETSIGGVVRPDGDERKRELGDHEEDSRGSCDDDDAVGEGGHHHGIAASPRAGSSARNEPGTTPDMTDREEGASQSVGFCDLVRVTTSPSTSPRTRQLTEGLETDLRESAVDKRCKRLRA